MTLKIRKASCAVITGVFLAFGLNFLGSSGSGKVITQSDGAVRGNSDMTLSAKELDDLEKKALGGAPDAALKIAATYLINRGPSDDAIYWASIAVENGSKEAMYELGYYLSLRRGERYQLRARYWFERVIKEGSPSDALKAREALQEMDGK